MQLINLIVPGLFLQGLLFFCSLMPQGLAARTAASDSLLEILKVSGEDSNKVNLLCELARVSKGIEQRDYSNQALGLAEKLQYSSGIAQSHILLGKYYYFSEDFSRSLGHCIKALDISVKSGDYKLSAVAARYIGYNHFQSAPKIAMKYYFKSIEFSRKAHDALLESYALSAMGNLYEKWEDGANALRYYLQSLSIREKAGTADELVSSLIETARAYNRVALYDKSMELVFKAQDIAETRGKDPQNLVYIYQMIGYDYAGRLKDYHKALNYFLKSYNLVVSQHALNSENVGSIPPVADMYMKLGDYQKSSEYYKMYFDLLEEHHKKLNRQLYELQDSLNDEMRRHEVLVKDSEILKQKADIQREENLRNIFIAGSIILLGFVFFFYHNYRRDKESNAELGKKVAEKTAELSAINQRLLFSEAKLTEMNKELESFVYKASHDLRGPLVSSKSLVDLAEKDEENSRTYISMIHASLDKLDHVLSSLHELSVVRQGNIILKEIDVERTLNDIIRGFEHTDNYKKIMFTIDNRLSSNFFTDEILFHTIVRNILENAIKYSCPTKKESFVTITLREEESFTHIRVSDNGIGIPMGMLDKVFDVFFRATDQSRGSGMGLYIVKNAVVKLKGRIEVESKEGEGTAFNLFFPKVP